MERLLPGRLVGGYKKKAATMSSQQRPAREPVKSSVTQRRAMTARRHEMAGAIRKAKKSHAVALKRRVGTTTCTSSSTVPSSAQRQQAAAATARATVGAPVTDEALRAEIATLADEYIKSAGGPTEVSALSALQTALAASEVTACSKAIESLICSSDGKGNENASASALLLADTLAKSLSSQGATDEMRLNAARVLTNLAVCGSNEISDFSVDNSYYGNVQENWCDVLVRSSAIGSLVGSFQALELQPMEQLPHQPFVALCEQCCWALGNIAGDSQRSREALRSGGVISPLVIALRFGLSLAAGASAGGSINAAEPVVGLCRNAAWALSNLARGTYSSAMPFLQMDNSDNEGGLLTASDLYQILSVHELSQYDAASASNVESSWMDVANEGTWLLNLITAKEDKAVEFLFSDSSTNNLLCASLASKLAKIVGALCNSDSNVAELALRSAVPCVRIVGNIAASCEGKYVPYLLANHNDVDSLAVSVTRIVQVGAQLGRDYAVLATEASWAAGTLLVDAGTTNHPSTASCEIFVPALCDVLISASSKIDLKREAASAICNAVSAPPPGQMAAAPETSQAIRDQILVRIANTKHIAESLTSLLICFDVDAVHSSLTLVDILLRRVLSNQLSSEIKTLFEEANIVDALETVCDRASATASYGSSEVWRGNGSTQEKSAEIAADLLDDIFDDDDIDDVAEGIAPHTGESTFAFGANNTPQAFDFGLSVASNSGVSEGSMGRGRGRGRGQVIPAWMKQDN